ncbi:MAG: glycosyltransferase involved in cell wall biosynthesis [Bacteroidia bacterium]
MDSNFNILHLSSPLSWRGGEQQLSYLHAGLLARGYNSKVFCPNEGVLASKLTVEERVLYNKRSGFDVFAAYKLAKYCHANPVDIIHAHDAHAHTTSVLAALLFRNKTPIVLSRRVDFAIGNSRFSRYKYNHKNIRVIACVSDAIKAMVEPKISNKAIEVTTIHSGVDLTRFEQVNPIDLRTEMSLEPSIKLVANFSALADHKDYFTFIDTAALVCASRKDVRFLIFGKGELETDLKAYTKEKGLEKQVLFVGFRQNLPDIYPNIDILLFTSKTEGLGTTVLDAFAAKVPVVATKAGGVPEMVIHEKTGLLTEVGDANMLAENVIQVLDNKTLSKQLTERAFEKCQDFSVDHMVNQTENWYKKVLNI